MDNQTPYVPQQPVQQPVTQPAAPVENDDSELSLTELWYLCIGRWPWFLLSVLLCLGIATLKLLRTQKTYTQHMEVMIKSDSRDYSGGTMGDFADLGLFQSNSNVNNELIAIMSPALSLEVVNEMELNTMYSEPGFFKDRTLYGQTLPVKVVFCDIDNEGYAAFHIDLKEDGSFTLSDFEGFDVEDEDEKVSLEGTLSQDTIQSPVGRLIVMNGMGYGSSSGDRSIDVVHIPASNAAGGVQGSLSAQVANKQATVITLTYVDVNRFRAADVLNTLIACYNRNWVNDKNQVATSTSQFINDRLAVIEKELGSVDTDISQYQSQNLISDVKAANQMYMAQANQASQHAVQLNNQLYMTKYLREYVSSDANKYQLLPANTGVEDRTIENLISTYNAKQLQRNSLVANSSVNNPVVLDLDKELTEMRNNLVRSIDNQITALNTQISSTRRTEAQSNAQMASNPTRQKYLLSVERQQKVKEQLYLYLLQKREENELSQAFTAYNTRVITPPMGSKRPTGPRSKMILLMAFLIGLALPLAYIYLRETMTTVVRGRKDIDNMKVPFIGELPQGEAATGSKRERMALRHQLVVKPDSRNLENEAFRILRTNLEFVAGKDTANPAQTILVTSMNPGSGKTYISMNLGATYAIAGQKTLVIDLDIRKSSASRYVGRPKEGITSILNGNITDWRSLVVNVQDRDNFDILPTGRIAPNPTELLQGDALKNLIEDARTQYDIIIFDCPPFNLVADTTLVSKYADLTLFVIRCGIF